MVAASRQNTPRATPFDLLRCGFGNTVWALVAGAGLAYHVPAVLGGAVAVP